MRVLKTLWWWIWPWILLLTAAEINKNEDQGGFSRARLESLRNQTRSMFYHGWDNYIQHAFPADELRPLTCVGHSADKEDPTNFNLNDVLGDYGVTLVDSLDMFAIMNDHENFVKYVSMAEETVSFNVSSTVQVFETTIRGMGGLLSAHLYATLPRLGHVIRDYDGKLLDLAYDLGLRLLPAFETKSGIPYPRVNLQKGVVPGGRNFVTETCTSGAGSLLLEFGLLSRLTGDPRFEHVARHAFLQIWSRRSKLNLVGMSLDAVNGQWNAVISGVGASIDSFYEYAVKYYILFNENHFFKIFHRMYRSLLNYSYDGWVFQNVNFVTGEIMTSWIDSLAAFFPGLQVLAGDLSAAIKNHLTYYKLWKTYGGIPERWYMDRDQDSIQSVFLEWYPLRPEFVESNYYLYQATNDPFYLEVGRQALDDLNHINLVGCGYAGTQDVRIGTFTNRMESFFLSETVKYLYLLFDRDNTLNKEYSNFVFSTEAHPLWYDNYVLEHASAEKFPWIAERVRRENEADHSGEEDLSDLADFSRMLKWVKKKVKQSVAPSYESSSKASSYFSSSLLGLASSSEYPVSSSSASPSLSSLSQPSSLSQQNEDSCEVWPYRDKWYSVIGSWHHFYELDSRYNFTSPRWLEDIRTPELKEGKWKRFYGQYVWPKAKSVPSKYEIFELAFAENKDEHGNIINTEKSVVKASTGVLYIENLGGHRLKLMKKENFVGAYQFIAVGLDGYTIENQVVIQQKFQGDEGGIMDSVNGVLHLQSIAISNVIFAS